MKTFGNIYNYISDAAVFYGLPAKAHTINISTQQALWNLQTQYAPEVYARILSSWKNGDAKIMVKGLPEPVPNPQTDLFKDDWVIVDDQKDQPLYTVEIFSQNSDGDTIIKKTEYFNL